MVFFANAFIPSFSLVNFLVRLKQQHEYFPGSLSVALSRYDRIVAEITKSVLIIKSIPAWAGMTHTFDFADHFRPSRTYTTARGVVTSFDSTPPLNQSICLFLFARRFMFNIHVNYLLHDDILAPESSSIFSDRHLPLLLLWPLLSLALFHQTFSMTATLLSLR